MKKSNHILLYSLLLFGNALASGPYLKDFVLIIIPMFWAIVVIPTLFIIVITFSRFGIKIIDLLISAVFSFVVAESLLLFDIESRNVTLMIIFLSCVMSWGIAHSIHNNILRMRERKKVKFGDSSFRQYDVVKVMKITKPFNEVEYNNADDFNKRLPIVGDIATIVEIYRNPTLGFELECSDENGITNWLMAFEPNEIEIKLIKEEKKK